MSPDLPRTITLDPSRPLDTFEGWGTSLAWFGHAIGNWQDEEKRAELMDLIFGSERGLGFNIVRYNIGGGERPGHDHMWPGAQVPGFAPAPGEWDPDADPGQRRVLREAVARGVNIVEAFSNSPPWWMTVSGCASGAEDGGNNLREECVEDFAAYLARVMRHLEDADGVSFRSLNPLNEPSSYTWSAGGHQEGCHVDRAMQARLLAASARHLAAHGLTHVGLSAPDETSVDETTGSYLSYSPDIRAQVAQINTHVYGGGNHHKLRALAEQEGKRLWMSEYGVGHGPHDHDDWRSALHLAQTIVRDLRLLRPAAWVYWQAVESEEGCVRRDDNGGLIHATFVGEETYALTRHFEVMRHFTRSIGPGSQFLEIDDPDSVAVMDARGQMTVVVVNPSRSPRTYRFSPGGGWTWTTLTRVWITGTDDRGESTVEDAQELLTVRVPAQALITLSFA